MPVPDVVKLIYNSENIETAIYFLSTFAFFQDNR